MGAFRRNKMMQRSSVSRRQAMAGLCLCCLPTTRLLAAEGPARMVQVAPGIYIRHGLTADAAAGNADAIANIGFIVGAHSVAVFDPGGSLADGRALSLAVRAATKLPIRYVILSHEHPDHVFGAAAFAPDHPVFVGHAMLPEALAARGAFYQAGLDRILGQGKAGPVITPTRLVHDRDSLDLGGRSLTLTAHSPAHTTCDLSALDSLSGVLLTGDLLFVERVPALDGSLSGWISELSKLKALGARNAVPGHGPVSVAWPGAAADLERYLTVLQTQTRASVADAVPIGQAATEVAASEREKWRLFDDYNGRNVIEAYRQIEWE
jgi:quinoprotein relay system zinc metallohydrolase 2